MLLISETYMLQQRLDLSHLSMWNWCSTSFREFFFGCLVVHLTKNVNQHRPYAMLRPPSLPHYTFSLIPLHCWIKLLKKIKWVIRSNLNARWSFAKIIGSLSVCLSVASSVKNGWTNWAEFWWEARFYAKTILDLDSCFSKKYSIM